MRRVRWIFFLALLLFAIVQAPAALVSALLENACQDRCTLSPTTGTLWQGQGELYLRDSVKRWRSVGTLAWSWQASALWRGQIVYVLHVAQGKITLAASFAGLSLAASGLAVPSSVIAAALPAAVPSEGWLGDWKIDGQAQCPRRLEACTGNATALWTEARINLMSDDALGDYRLKLNRATPTAALSIDWQTTRGPLWLNASAELSNQGIVINGEAWAEGPNQARLENYLRPLGPYNPASGHYRVKWPLRQ